MRADVPSGSKPPNQVPHDKTKVNTSVKSGNLTSSAATGAIQFGDAAWLRAMT